MNRDALVRLHKGMWANGKPPALGAGHHAGSSPVIPTIKFSHNIAP